MVTGSEGLTIAAGTDLLRDQWCGGKAVQASLLKLNQGRLAVWNRLPRHGLSVHAGRTESPQHEVLQRLLAGGRSHSEAVVGCIVWSATARSATDNASRTTPA
jgi:hypothetical protein